jgi:hypothetical protein
LLLVLSCAAIASEKPEVPMVDGHLGRCSANFTVRDNEQKPIYNAKIDVRIHYGFLGLHKNCQQRGSKYSSQRPELPADQRLASELLPQF